MLSYARRSEAGQELKRTNVMALPGGRIEPADQARSVSHWSRSPTLGGHVVVTPNLVACWLAQQLIGASPQPFTLLTSTHDRNQPDEWSSPAFWIRFDRVTLLKEPTTDLTHLEALISASGEVDFRVAEAPELKGWIWELRNQDLTLAEFLYILDQAEVRRVPVLGSRDGGILRSSSRTSIHDLDSEGRLRRVIAVEQQQQLPDDRRMAVRYEDLVVRSDGKLLSVVHLNSPPGTPPSMRIVALSDGERLERSLQPSDRSQWSYQSALKFVSAMTKEGQRLSADDCADELVAILPVDVVSRGARHVAAYVLATYLYAALPYLPILWIVAPDGPQRRDFASALAAVCHSGRLAGRDRADNLASLSSATGGTLVWDQPGVVEGPSGLTDLGRFLMASVRPLSSEFREWDRKAGYRTLRTYGPRIVLSRSRPPSGIATDTIVIDDVTPARMAPFTSYPAIVDLLYSWSMQRVAEVNVNAGLERGSHLGSLLAAVDLRTSELPAENPANSILCTPADPPKIMAEALEAAKMTSGRQISITQLLLEAALRGGAGEAFTPERVGRWLATSGEVEGEPSRRRLHGHIARIYQLVSPLLDGDPFEFCKGPCTTCAYLAVCDATIDGLRTAKQRRSV